LGSSQLEQKKAKSVFADTMRFVTVHRVYEDEMSFENLSTASQPQGKGTRANVPKIFLPFNTSNPIGCQRYPRLDI